MTYNGDDKIYDDNKHYDSKTMIMIKNNYHNNDKKKIINKKEMKRMKLKNL
jgi:hypothetical protein